MLTRSNPLDNTMVECIPGGKAFKTHCRVSMLLNVIFNLKFANLSSKIENYMSYIHLYVNMAADLGWWFCTDTGDQLNSYSLLDESISKWKGECW
jgi:hypothetical protein